MIRETDSVGIETTFNIVFGGAATFAFGSFTSITFEGLRGIIPKGLYLDPRRIDEMNLQVKMY